MRFMLCTKIYENPKTNIKHIIKVRNKMEHCSFSSYKQYQSLLQQHTHNMSILVFLWWAKLFSSFFIWCACSWGISCTLSKATSTAGCVRISLVLQHACERCTSMFWGYHWYDNLHPQGILLREHNWQYICWCALGLTLHPQDSIHVISFSIQQWQLLTITNHQLNVQCTRQFVHTNDSYTQLLTIFQIFF